MELQSVLLPKSISTSFTTRRYQLEILVIPISLNKAFSTMNSRTTTLPSFAVIKWNKISFSYISIIQSVILKIRKSWKLESVVVSDSIVLKAVFCKLLIFPVDEEMPVSRFSGTYLFSVVQVSILKSSPTLYDPGIGKWLSYQRMNSLNKSLHEVSIFSVMS